MILVAFFLIEGGVSIMFAIEHRRHFSSRWAFMFASGVVDIVLASLIILAVPGTSAWTMGLLVAVNMVVGGAALIAIGIRARTEWAGAKAIPARNPRLIASLPDASREFAGEHSYTECRSPILHNLCLPIPFTVENRHVFAPSFRGASRRCGS
jgi:hypothetical protein